jgi:hypothetical protein
MAAPSAAHAAPSIAINAPDSGVDSVAIEMGISGTATSSSNTAWLAVEYPGDPCSTDPQQNRSNSISGGTFSQSTGSGDYSFSMRVGFDQYYDPPGTYVLCAWLTDENQNGAVVANTSRPFELRSPQLSLSIAVPPVVTRDKPFDISAIAQAEAPRSVWLNILPDTSACPATESGAEQTLGQTEPIFDHPVFGPVTLPTSQTLHATGSYLACGYFYREVAHGHNDEITRPPEATAQTSIHVIPPCVVPHRVRGMRLAAAKTLVLQGNCRLGRTKHVPSHRYLRGRVTGASVPLDQDQDPGHLVHLSVSTGTRPAKRH